MFIEPSVLGLPLDVTTPRDSYAWNYRELATLPTLCESLVRSGTGTTDPWVCKSAPLTTEPSSHLEIFRHE